MVLSTCRQRLYSHVKTVCTGMNEAESRAVCPTLHGMDRAALTDDSSASPMVRVLSPTAGDVLASRLVRFTWRMDQRLSLAADVQSSTGIVHSFIFFFSNGPSQDFPYYD